MTKKNSKKNWSEKVLSKIMGETNKHMNKCKTACILNPVISQESSVGIEKSKNEEEQLQGEMAETTLTKERLSDDNYICTNEPTYPMEQNSKSSSENTNKFKRSIVGIPKKDDGNEALEMIEQDKELETVKDTNQKDANEGASGTKRSISGISQDGNDTPSISKKSKTKMNTPKYLDPKQE